jgi:FtsP/CotA-like multicopper oxidase with cupredoxin domain
VDVCLRVDPYEIPGSTVTPGPFGNTTPITMWGFVQTGTGPGCTFTGAGPGTSATAAALPTLSASAGDTLRIHLMNNLPLPVAGAVYTEPVSVVIPGQPSVMTPTWTDATTGNRTALPQRVRSFAAETPQQSASPVVYTFGPLKAGTYLLQSGTHQAVQMQMGLYGVLNVYGKAPVPPATGGLGYTDPSSAFDSEVSLLFSEIDPALHDAVARGQYGPNTAPPPGWLTSTIDYRPRYFLVNGKPYTKGSPAMPIGATNRNVLVRLLNAGLDTKVPVLQSQYVSIIAEDGNFYTTTGFLGTPPNLVPGSCPAPKEQYSILLPAGKTIDAILTTPSSPVTIPVYDRRLHLTNSGASPGGMLVFLTTTSEGGGKSPPPPPPPCALVGRP